MRTLLLSATLLLATVAGAAELTETIDKTFDVKAGSNVVLTNVNGGITITSWDQPRVRVVARKEVNGNKDEIKSALQELRVEMTPRAGGLVVMTHYPKESEGIGSLFSWLSGGHIDAEVRYDVTVPRTMNVDVTNTNGAIRLTDVSGTLELDTTNGKIEVERGAGSLSASTTNGSIHAEMVRVAQGQPLEFETTNGRIELALPSNLGVNVDASTTNGSISTDFPVATTRTSSNSLRGTINGGGMPVRLRTTNGGIAIRTAGRS